MTRHSTTGKWEAHLWDGAYSRPKKGKGSGGRSRGRQVEVYGACTSLLVFDHQDCNAFGSNEVAQCTAVIQVYLGGWGTEVAAGTAYDLGALFFWGTAANLNVRLVQIMVLQNCVRCETL